MLVPHVLLGHTHVLLASCGIIGGQENIFAVNFETSSEKVHGDGGGGFIKNVFEVPAQKGGFSGVWGPKCDDFEIKVEGGGNFLNLVIDNFQSAGLDLILLSFLFSLQLLRKDFIDRVVFEFFELCLVNRALEVLLLFKFVNALKTEGVTAREVHWFSIFEIKFLLTVLTIHVL